MSGRVSLLWVFAVICLGTVRGDDDHYHESLWVEGLPGDHVHSRMEFLIRTDGRHENNYHTRLFPRALSEILEAHGVEELTFTLTQGHWQLDSWGDPYPVRVAPTGAHVSAWFRTKSSDEGYFCLTAAVIKAILK